MSSETNKAMQSRKSKNECPWCGGKEWNCIFAGMFEGITRVSNPIDVLVNADRHWPVLVDAFEMPLGTFRRFDECTNCGCVVS